MKPKTQITASILALIILSGIGIFVVEVYSPKAARVKAWFYPRTHTLDNPPPQPWNVDLKFSPPRTVDEINTSTILLEGMYSPSAEPYDHPRVTSRVVVPFDGYDVLTAAILKAGHMSPGSHTIVLEITGQLKDGTPFNTGGSGVIVIFVDDFPPP